MCHFHSVIVTGDGRILHLAENSHSSIASHYGLESGLDAKWWECEWDGRGSMPVNIIDNRGKGAPTQAAERAAERHYEKLARIMAGELDPSETAPFDAPEYSDVRAAYKQAAVLKQLEPIIALIEELDYQEDAIREIIDQLNLDVDKIAKERIQKLKTEKEQAFDLGVEAASEDMYSPDYIYENWRDFMPSDIDLEDEFDTEFTAAREESYAEGYRDCQQGKPNRQPEYFVDGMPSFLL